MPSELIRFKTKDNLELQGLLYEPKQESVRAIIHVHGWIGNFYENLFIDSFAESALQKNIAFFTFNNRGAGVVTEFIRNNKRERIGGSLEIFEESVFDIEGAIDFLQKKGYQEIILQGHSLGCQKIVYFQNNKKDNRVKGLILSAPVNDAEFVSKKLLDKSKYEKSIKIAKEMIQNGKGQDAVPDWMQFYPLLSANMFIQVSDPNSTSGRILDYSGELIELKNIEMPILAIFGSEDDYQVEPAEKLELLKNTIKCTVSLMKDSDHWFTSHEDELAKKVLDWITKNT